MSKKLLLLPALLGAFLLFAPGCGDDDACADVDCGEFGVCNNGDCDCDTGYELGSTGVCNVLSREKFIGTYQCNDNCVPGASWTSSITNSASGVNKVVISNFANSGQSVTCTIDGVELTLDAGAVTTGSGSITNNTLTINFGNPAPPPTTCQMTMIKQ